MQKFPATVDGTNDCAIDAEDVNSEFVGIDDVTKLKKR